MRPYAPARIRQADRGLKQIQSSRTLFRLIRSFGGVLSSVSGATTCLGILATTTARNSVCRIIFSWARRADKQTGGRTQHTSIEDAGTFAMIKRLKGWGGNPKHYRKLTQNDVGQRRPMPYNVVIGSMTPTPSAFT